MAGARTGESTDRRAPLSRRLATVLVPGAVLAVLPHPSIGASRILPVLQALLPVLFLAALGLCAVLAFRRSFAPAAVLLALAAASMLPVFAPSTGTTCTPGAPVKVLSLNAGRGHADAAALAEVVGGSDPDVLVLVESSEPTLAALAARVPEPTMSTSTMSTSPARCPPAAASTP